MAAEFAADVDVVTVYIVEAHPTDEWDVNTGLDSEACVRQPRTLQQRGSVATSFATRYEYPSERFVIDNMDNTVSDAYSAVPERLFVVDGKGKLAYVGGIGPYHYDPTEVRAFLVKALAKTS